MTLSPDYFCLSCLGKAFYKTSVDLIDGTEAWLHSVKNAISEWNSAE